MSREIMFRAWDKKRNIMVTNCDLVILNETFETEEYDGQYGKEITIGDDLEIMQYTGLKDKNGVEIWEGDIVKTGISASYVVSIEDIYEYKGSLKKEWGEKLEEQTEVIGNIYQNKELLTNLTYKYMDEIIKEIDNLPSGELKDELKEQMVKIVVNRIKHEENKKLFKPILIVNI